MLQELTSTSVLIDPGAGFLVQGFGAEVVTVTELGHQHLHPGGSQLPGRNQGLSKGNRVCGRILT